MLKALELVGFKSFADKTRFEFNPGITVVVGPNGSGKSNVVDAIKWVLGEQSVKSLRGKEMADVIFNGSASRRPLNSAETTLMFDNSDGRLPMAALEVHIARRVYRSGEGEYLINRQPCRLRDIRDLFAGTGAATEAYSVIEQGKVDVLLQSSPRDRRLIFEEAAGISRFKAKKVEALRRLERVDQNLLRLSDIVDEVEGRLRTVRQQAGKARRYTEMTDRLQALRIQVGWTDWRQLTEKLSAAEAEIATHSDEKSAGSTRLETVESRAVELEHAMAQIDGQIRSGEARVAENRERLAGLEASIEHDRAHCRDVEEQAARNRRQLASLNVRAGDVEDQMRAAMLSAADAQQRHRQAAMRSADHQRTTSALTAQLDQLRADNEQRRAAFLEETRGAAVLANEINLLRSQLGRAEEARDLARARQTELRSERERLAAELTELEAIHQRLADRLASDAAALAAAQSQLADLRLRQSQQQTELAALRERRSAAAERARVLSELESRLEGVSAGVKEALALAQTEPRGPFAAVRGMLADLLQVDVKFAPFIELALGERAQHLVLAPEQTVLTSLATDNRRFQGRVGFLALKFSAAHHGEMTGNTAAPDPASAALDFTGRAGVLGRADQFIQTAAEYVPLIRRILDRTWIVESLVHAWQLEKSASGMNFVTLGGEFLAADGTLTVGPLQSATGLISRRSELRSLGVQIAGWERTIAESGVALAALERQLIQHEADVLDLAARHQQSAEALSEGRLRLGAAGQRQIQVVEQAAANELAQKAAADECETTAARLASGQSQLNQLQGALALADLQMIDTARRIAELDAARESRNRETTTTQIELARFEQQLDHLRGQLQQYEQDRQERQRSIAEARDQLEQSLVRIREAEDRILASESQLAELYLRKESFGDETEMLVNQRENHRQERAAAVEESLRHRSKLRKTEEKLHKRELAASQLRLERDALVQRLREDYNITLPTGSHPGDETTAAGAASDVPPDVNVLDRSQVEDEIADLRRKLGGIGNVNLDSLHEADELEKRFQLLSNQFQDLSKAKAALQQIVGKINADSRRLFAETLETVRGHFQELFRKLFGGGQADIVLEEGADILDTGIEIVARPPGKEPRNISLLSGGEKTLTCVALLLAIFRSRPSPFCVLDEVDAALDEANTERFVAVLGEFLSWTRFIVVTHSKKTMTAANTLYGVTMQESGVSKRVSVRFEDVSENGEIQPAAIESADASPSATPPDDEIRRAA